MKLLAASANQYSKLKKENYFIFMDSISNGYYSQNNMPSYSDLPLQQQVRLCHTVVSV